MAYIGEGAVQAFCLCNFLSGGSGLLTSFNVSSVDDSGTGNFEVNFSTAFTSGDYIVTHGADLNNHSRGYTVFVEGRTTTELSLFGVVHSFNSRQDGIFEVAVFGNQ